jgi:4-amino-4-deoxy-L-arabinose transferase-like glycosyltransferase
MMQQFHLLLRKPSLRDRLLLLLFGALLFLPFLGAVHLFDWDEINFAEAAREMIVTGDYMRPQIDFKPFWEKPPLFFWLQTLSMRLIGVNEYAARFVNAVAGIITMLLVYGVGTRLHSRLFGLFWALLFCGSLLPHILFTSGVIDPWFNLFIFCGIVSLARTTTPDTTLHRRWFLISGVWIGLAVLTKGPAGFGIAVICWGAAWLAGRCRPIARRGDIVVFGLAAGATAALFYGTETLLHGTWFLREFISYHLRLFATSEAGHGQPFYFHPVVLLLGCFPASVLAIRGFFMARTATNADFSRWMAILFWVVLIAFSIVKTKTALYSSLCYFPLTYFAALHCSRLVRGECTWQRRWSVALLCVGVAIGLALIGLPQLLVHKQIILPHIADRFTVGCLERPVAWSGFESLAGAFWLLVMGAGVLLCARRRARAGLFTMLIGGALAIPVVMLVLTPKIEDHFQGAPITFYTSLAGQDCYIKPLFKTYAHLFYGRTQPRKNPASADREWLLSGPVDRPAYFVARIYNGEELARKYGLRILRIDGGFVFMQR